MLHRQNDKLAAAFVILSGLMFALMATSIKLVSDDVETEVIVFFRNLFGFLAILPFVFRAGGDVLKTKIPHWHIMRSLAGLGAMYCFFFAIGHIPLSNAVLLSYTTPLFAPIMAFFLLKEHISKQLMMPILVGFIGVTFLLNPDFQTFSWMALVALLSGVFAAFAMTTIRRMSVSEPTLRIVFYYGLICTMASALPMFFIDVWPSSKNLLILVAVGCFASLGQMCITRGYGLASVSKVGPFMYSTVVFASVLAWVKWQELPSTLSFVGILLVIVAGSLALLSQKTEANNEKH